MEDTRCLCIQLISSEWATVRTNIYTLIHTLHFEISEWLSFESLSCWPLFLWFTHVNSICSICVYACVSVYFAADFAHDRKKAVNFG